jgi:hypothetical protein
MIGWNLEPDFKGEGLESEIKKKIDSIPQEFFYPKNVKIVEIKKEKEIENVEKIFKQISPKSELEMKNFLNSISFPEPKLFDLLKEREEKTIIRQTEKEKEIQKEKIETELKLENSKKRIKKNENFIELLKDFHQYTLENPPQSLLHELYMKETDSNVTLKILHQLETKGTLPVEERSNDEEEILMRQYMENKNKIPISSEEIKITIPKINLKNVKDVKDTLQILSEFEETKRKYKQTMDYKLREMKFKTILSLKNQFQSEEQKNEWNKYLDQHYIKPFENDVFLDSLKNPKDFDEKLKHLSVNDSFITEEEKLKFQFENLLIKDEFFEKIKSKL